jgi:hypothetical protein
VFTGDERCVQYTSVVLTTVGGLSEGTCDSPLRLLFPVLERDDAVGPHHNSTIGHVFGLALHRRILYKFSSHALSTLPGAGWEEDFDAKKHSCLRPALRAKQCCVALRSFVPEFAQAPVGRTALPNFLSRTPIHPCARSDLVVLTQAGPSTWSASAKPPSCGV